MVSKAYRYSETKVCELEYEPTVNATVIRRKFLGATQLKSVAPVIDSDIEGIIRHGKGVPG